MPKFLHVGCGVAHKAQTTRGFNTPEWDELRLDIDPKVKPDLVGTMTAMPAVATASVDAVYSSHNIEHLYAHEVPLALGEFRRVLRPGGFVVITCPDLQAVGALLAEGKLTEAAYQSPSGPIAPVDILYGYRPSLAQGSLYMAHHCGFTEKVLVASLQTAGFARVASRRRPPAFELWALATAEPTTDQELRTLAHAHFPR